MGDCAGNLAHHRAARSVWEKRGWSGVTIEERVGPLAVSLTGTALILAGLRRRSWTGIHLVIGGVTLITCAAAGLCNPRHAAIRWRSLTEGRPDPLTFELMDSFPASDPSSLTATTVGIVAVA
jgi:hypothetical protein